MMNKIYKYLNIAIHLKTANTEYFAIMRILHFITFHNDKCSHICFLFSETTFVILISVLNIIHEGL
jgi:hypothetical protein